MHTRREIISVGLLIVERKSLTEKESYYSLVRPKINTVLNPYCQELTGLKQVEVDHAPDFRNCVRRSDEAVPQVEYPAERLSLEMRINRCFLTICGFTRVEMNWNGSERVCAIFLSLCFLLFLKKKVACLWKKQAGYWTCLWTERFTMRLMTQGYCSSVTGQS